MIQTHKDLSGSFDSFLGILFILIGIGYLFLDILKFPTNGISILSISVSLLWILSGVLMFAIGNAVIQGKIWGYTSSMLFHGIFTIFSIALILSIRNLKSYPLPFVTKTIGTSLITLILLVFILYNLYFIYLFYEKIQSPMEDNMGKSLHRKKEEISPTLVIVNKGNEEYNLNDDNISIGREEGNTIILENDLVSKQHAIIFKRKRTYFIKDLNSTNGTFINDKKTVPNKIYKLKDGDKIGIGPFVLLFKAKLKRKRA